MSKEICPECKQVHSSSMLVAECYRAHNDRKMPPETRDERVRRSLEEARRDLTRCALYQEQHPSIVALHSAVSHMLDTMQIT